MSVTWLAMPHESWSLPRARAMVAAPAHPAVRFSSYLPALFDPPPLARA